VAKWLSDEVAKRDSPSLAHRFDEQHPPYPGGCTKECTSYWKHKSYDVNVHAQMTKECGNC